jgi:hypothetical protein
MATATPRLRSKRVSAGVGTARRGGGGPELICPPSRRTIVVASLDPEEKFFPCESWVNDVRSLGLRGISNEDYLITVSDHYTCAAVASLRDAPAHAIQARLE